MTKLQTVDTILQPIHLAVCDNEQVFIDGISDVIKQSMDSGSYVLHTFSDPLAMLNSSDVFNIAVLDIQMPELTGIDLAAELVKRCPECQIIFVSSYTDYVTEVYDTPHLCFILKSRIPELLPHYLQRARQTLEALEGQTLYIEYRGSIVRVQEKNILYIERTGRNSSIVCKDGSVHPTLERIETIFERLSAGSFCRCHASFIVDLRYVTAYNRTEFVMSDGRDIPISRAFSATTKQAFSRFIGDQI